jgi:hypothetical protein
MVTHPQEVTQMPPKRKVGRPRKDDPLRPQKTSITISGSRWVALKHHAVEHRTSVTALLSDAIDHYILKKGR